MVDLDRATDLFGFDGEHHQDADQYRERLGPGLVHADFSDPDHVFLVTVHQVRRLQLLDAPRAVAELPDGTTVRLLAVELANHVTVTLSAAGPAADDAAASYRAAVEQWGRHPEQDPPLHPGEALGVGAVQLRDHAGTRYAPTSAETGHPDDPWRVVVRFRPTPPPDATRLGLRFGDGDEVSLDLPPWDGR
ncbi:hypothetical protein [Klenkia brasiliensis]|uniref:Uncharacterized protein n=1 Tax=Klenkia brasiliensis TaxID=333142 RepID=A0A1G7SPK5_9ACTN|nr:hypothetical protein [Klenkia brasiliensis]SDG24822.1 hypothetical protein SAMN05660324_2107 [Klenkia brasiliensis]